MTRGLDLYDPLAFWDARLGARWDLSGVGHAAYSLGYNRWLYRAQGRALEQALYRARATVAGKSVLDVGSGTGHWLTWYAAWGAGPRTALELSPIGALRLRERFRDVTVAEGNIADPPPGLLSGTFAIVNILGVVYHIVDPAAAERALANLARLTAPGGRLVLSDALGSEEATVAPHVRFRPLAFYEQRLPSLGFAIDVVEPVHTLLNGGLSAMARSRPVWLRRWIYSAEDVLGPLLYLLDRAPGLGRHANMRVMVATKIGG